MSIQPPDVMSGTYSERIAYATNLLLYDTFWYQTNVGDDGSGIGYYRWVGQSWQTIGTANIVRNNVVGTQEIFEGQLLIRKTDPTEFTDVLIQLISGDSTLYRGTGVVFVHDNYAHMRKWYISMSGDSASDFAIGRFDDSDTFVDSPITISRSTGQVTFGQIIRVNNGITIDTGTLNLVQSATPANPPSGYDKLYFKSDDKLYGLNSSGTESLIGPAATTSPNSICEGRLTLTTVTPITTTDVTGATNIFWTPYKGNRIALYDGSSTWNIRTTAEVTIPLGTLTVSICYDVFAYDNATVPTFELLAWSSATARATALVLQDGVLVKSGATTRRYIGTFYTQTTTTTDDSKSTRGLFNYYNRVRRTLLAVDTTNTWTYNSGTWRAANASSVVGVGRVQIVVGYSEDLVDVRVMNSFTTTGANQEAAVGIGIDATNANSAETYGGAATSTAAVANVPLLAIYRGYPGVGFHFISALEVTDGNNVTFFGDNGSTIMQTGLTAEIMA